MKTENFLKNLNDRFDLNKIVLHDIGNNLKQYSDQNRAKLWNAVIDTYTYQSPPNWASIYKIALNAGIHKTAMTQGYSYWQCGECETMFAYDLSNCPRCKEAIKLYLHVQDTEPRGLIKEDGNDYQGDYPSLTELFQKIVKSS